MAPIDREHRRNCRGLNGTNGFAINGYRANSQTGTAVAVGDVNGDGIKDILLGAPAEINNTKSDYGYIIWGQSSFTSTGGTLNLSSLAANGSQGLEINYKNTSPINYTAANWGGGFGWNSI